MKSKINSSIRTGVQEVMDDFTWLESIRKDDEINRLKGSNLSEGYKEERCMICTLPIGSCEHNTKWMDDSLATRLIDSSELEIDSALEILGGNDRRTPQTPLMIDAEADVDLEHLCWEVFDDRPVDRIGEAKVHLFTPFGRFWHSSTNVGNFVVTFGGLQIRKEKIYQDIRQIEDAKDFEFLNDLRVYNNSKQSWHGVRANGNQNTEAEENEVFLRPKPRYGHAAAALDDRTLLMFGGRGEFNAVYGDTWIYDIEEDVWKEIDSITYHGHKVMPPPRFHSSMTAIPDRCEIYLFGGTNEEDLFGDLWVFRKFDMLWEKIITVGFSPTPRYGHVLLPIERQKTLIVIGGCTVSPMAEWEAQQLPEEVSIAQMHRKYQSLLDTQFLHLNKKLRGLSTTDYRIAEEKLFDSWQKAKAMSYYLKKTTKHTNPVIDISFYNIKDQMWIDRKFPKFSGEIPKSRMYFCAQAIGHYLFVVGGAYPTSLFTKCVDQNGQQHVDINVLDLRTHTWTKPLPINSDEYYKQTMLIAEADIIRAQKKLQAERLEGLSLGAPGGLTREVAIAQAMVNVCIWRKQQLENKTKEDFLSPNPIIGASFTAVRQRLLLVGGFTPGLGYRQDVLALSVENIYERERRLEEMYHAKLELDRKEEEKKLAMENLITSYELRAAIMEEKRNRERELQEMAVQDYLSSLPPLSYPNPVKLVKANHNTIWVEWDRVHEDSSGNQVDQKDIIYFLYMKSSIETLRENDEVVVEESTQNELTSKSSIETLRENDEVVVEESTQNELTSKRPRRPFSRGEQYRGPKEGSYFSEFCHRYPGLIRKVKGKGLFDILYDDGSYEANVPRYRIKLNKATAPQSPSSPSSVPSTASTARTSYTGHIPGLDLKINTRKSLIEGIASNLQNQYTPKKITSPKKLKLLQRLSFMKSTKANKLRHLHESSSKPMPLQGTILLHYPATLALHHPYPNSFLPPLSSRASSNPQTARTDQSGFNREALYNPLLADIDELSSTQESIHSNSSFNFPINQYDEEIKARTEQPTVKIDEDWRLIYVGNDNHYACSNIISQDIFESEVGVQAAVMFSVQVQGIDFPRYERSRLSKPMIYYTINPAPIVKAAPQPVSVSVVKPDGNLNDGTGGESGLGAISKTRKEIITAVINAGQIIQIEKRGYYTYGEGVGDHYD